MAEAKCIFDFNKTVTGGKSADHCGYINSSSENAWFAKSNSWIH
jgi:hypothetical protein